MTSFNPETNNFSVSGVSERHLDIQLERLQQEYNIEVKVGTLRVEYRETITQPASFNARFVRQSSCPGQYAHVIGKIEPCEERFVFENRVVNEAIPAIYLPACEQGFLDAMKQGSLAGYPVTGVKVILEDGSFHATESRELSYQIAARLAFKQAFSKANPVLLEPIMLLEVTTPTEFMERIQSDLLSRRGVLWDVETRGDYSFICVEVPVSQILGYGAILHALSDGLGHCLMEFSCYRPLPVQVLQKIFESLSLRDQKNQ